MGFPVAWFTVSAACFRRVARPQPRNNGLAVRCHASLCLPRGLHALPVSFLRPLQSLIGVFQGVFRMLVSGLVIFFPMVRGGGTMPVRG